MRLSVIIAAHNEGQALAKTVASCVETCAGLDYEILVADDASWDGSLEEVERRFSRVRVLTNLERQGPSPTKDRGARAAAGDVLVFLDGHTKPERGALARLADDVGFLGGQYVGRYGTKFTLTQNEGAGIFTLAAPNGETLVFNDFNVANAGLFQSRTTAGGQILQVTSYAPGTALGIGEVQRSYSTGGVTTIESFLYNHVGDDLAGVMLRRKIGTGAWQNVRQVLYAYYGDDDPNGSFGDLKTATVQTWNAGAWQTIDSNYYRYWTFDGGGGLWHGLKYVLGGAAYDRMAAAGLDPLTATDAQLAGYADNYFEYDADRHVRKEATNGGLYVTTFSRATNTNPDYTDGYNNWQTKVVEGRADGSTNTVYCNYVNDPILAELALGTDKWITPGRLRDDRQFGILGQRQLAAD